VLEKTSKAHYLARISDMNVSSLGSALH